MLPGRLFLCALCKSSVFICHQCDRGQRYCSTSCSKSARKKQLRQSAKRYQQKPKGQMNHALRQRRYRKRTPALKKVTHQSSQRKASVASCGTKAKVSMQETGQCCFFCGKVLMGRYVNEAKQKKGRCLEGLINVLKR